MRVILTTEMCTAIWGADSSTWSISASAEYGREFSLGESSFIEPQAQLVYTRLDEARYTTSSGLRVRQNDIDSVIGRVGLREVIALRNARIATFM